MEPSEFERVWQELEALRERVRRLEAERPQASVQAAALEEAAWNLPAERPLSFVPPPRPSLESRIGSQLFNRLGIVAVLIGAAWFLKYAVDREWLGPLARVLVGFAAGLGLIGWSERFRRRRYPVFSFSLKAVGTGLLYLALWAAFSLFHLIPYPLAFAGMVLVTAGNAAMCWYQRSEVLAAFAAVGGFLTPALLAPDHTSVATLGSYLCLLNAGLFGLMLLGRWASLLLAAFAGTSVYLLMLALRPEEQGATTLLLLLFFAVFSIAPLLLAGFHSSDEGGGATARIAVTVTLLNAGLGTFELWRVLAARWLGLWIAAWFAVLLLARRTRVFGAARAEGGLPAALEAMVAGFAAWGFWTGLPSGGTIACWALEAALLLLLPRRGSLLAAQPVPAGVLLLGSAVYLLGCSIWGDLRAAGPLLLNRRSALYLLVIAVAVLGVRVAARRAEASAGAQWTRAGAGAAVLAAVLLLIAGVLEIDSYWRGSSGTAEQFWVSAWAALLGVGLLVLGFQVRWAFLRWQALALLTLAVAKVFVVDTRALSQGFRILSFLGLGVLLLCVSFIYQRDLLNLRGKEHGG